MIGGLALAFQIWAISYVLIESQRLYIKYQTSPFKLLSNYYLPVTVSRTELMKLYMVHQNISVGKKNG